MFREMAVKAVINGVAHSKDKDLSIDHLLIKMQKRVKDKHGDSSESTPLNLTNVQPLSYPSSKPKSSANNTGNNTATSRYAKGRIEKKLKSSLNKFETYNPALNATKQVAVNLPPSIPVKKETSFRKQDSEYHTRLFLHNVREYKDKQGSSPKFIELVHMAKDINSPLLRKYDIRVANKKTTRPRWFSVDCDPKLMSVTEKLKKKRFQTQGYRDVAY